MFYPADDIDDIMPDALVPSIDQKSGSGHKTRIGYFTKRPKTLQELVEMKKQAKRLETKPVAHNSESMKGIVPANIMIHSTICYSYKHGAVMLNGLDNSTKK